MQGGNKLQIVNVDNQILGRQFTPYLQAVVTDQFDEKGERILMGIDPLFADASRRPTELWQSRQIRLAMENNG
jgi:hypothetical protein